MFNCFGGDCAHAERCQLYMQRLSQSKVLRPTTPTVCAHGEAAGAERV